MIELLTAAAWTVAIVSGVCALVLAFGVRS
jgi:hypothetical protein